MPLIGFDRGDLGGGTDWGGTAAGDPVGELRDLLDPWRDDPAPPPAEGFWAWVAVATQEVTPVVWTRWRTAADERVCPECGPLDGLAWEEGAGVSPPLHVNCRCVRAYAFTEWRVRPAIAWELRWVAA